MWVKPVPHPYAIIYHVSGLGWVRCLWEVDRSSLVDDVEPRSRQSSTFEELSVATPIQTTFGCVALIHARSWACVPFT